MDPLAVVHGVQEPPQLATGVGEVQRMPPTSRRTASHYLVEVAKLGGHLARTKDPPRGNLVVWRGLTRLTDILFGFELNAQGVGNRKLHRTPTAYPTAYPIHNAP